jgi:hypothetical protein
VDRGLIHRQITPRALVYLQHAIQDGRVGVRVGERESAATVPLDLNDLDRPIGKQTTDTGARLQEFKRCRQIPCPAIGPPCPPNLRPARRQLFVVACAPAWARRPSAGGVANLSKAANVSAVGGQRRAAPRHPSAPAAEAYSVVNVLVPGRGRWLVGYASRAWSR